MNNIFTEIDDWSDAMIDDPSSSQKVRELNDKLRTTLTTGGTVVVTAGIMALAPDKQAEVLAKVRTFNAFTDDNDPWNEHDMGVFEIELTVGFGGTVTERVMWKIDYYDLAGAYMSADPADPTITERVLTIMLASEY